MMHIHTGKIRWMVGIAALLLLVQGCAAKTSRKQEGVALATISSITPSTTNDKTELVIEGEQPLLQYTSFQLTEPLRLVVDITEASIGKFKDRITINQGAVIDVNPSQVDNVARLEIGLAQPVEARVYQSGGKVRVDFGKGPELTKAEQAQATTDAAVPATAETKEAPAVKEETPAPAPAKEPATIISSVKAVSGADGINVVITGNGGIQPNTFMLEGKRLVIDIPGARNTVRPKVIPVRKGGVDKIRVGQHENKVRVVLDLTSPMEYTATPDSNKVTLALHAASSKKSEEVKPAETAPASAPAAAETASPQSAQNESAAVQEPMAAQATTEGTGAKTQPAIASSTTRETTIGVGSGKYSGRRISLDFQDADLVNVMRLFAEVANLNIILSPDVKGKVTVRMVNIPWDQAMDIILKMNGLGHSLEDNILRIGTLAALAREADEETKAKEAKKKAEDLITRVMSINYTEASTVEATLRKSLSTRGEIVVDSRTNTIIVKDLASNIDDVTTLVKLLDRPTAQVMIEARIVEASLNFNRSIGVQWGGKGSMSSATGNGTSYNFPNSISVTGGSTMGSTASGIGNYIVNLPAAAGASSGGAAVGITFGSLSGALNLDLVLSALESTGEGKVISQPRVSALDNKEAKIEQGLSIPFSTVSAGGTQIQFVDAKLSLTVTPHVTPDNKVFLKINAQKNAPDTSLLGASGQPSIRKNEAKTEILLADGETAVIGGILTIDRTSSVEKIPFFGDIPILGWFFQKKTISENKRELIIFLTPRVVKQETV